MWGRKGQRGGPEWDGERAREERWPTPTRTRAGTRTGGMAENSDVMLDTAVSSTPPYAREMLPGGVAGVVAKTAVAA
ncbi:hypothetical protein ZWY2020_036313 [Hordeum vulgare]|nr:hypothetical protein ZWY2020_036313 [Hordeum vulgare]